MSKLSLSSADQVDNHRRFLFLAMLLLSLTFAIKAGIYFVDDSTKSYLEVAGKSLFALGAGALAITIFWKLKFIPRNDRHLLTSTDSFVNQKMNEACKISWILTFLLLCFVTKITWNDGSALPVQFYIDVSLSFMLAAFSVSFFILFSVGDSGERQHADV